MSHHVSLASYDWQVVSDTASFLYQAVSSIMSHPSPTESEWQWFISLPGSLINHVSSHDQQPVSDTALFLFQALSSMMSHPMTNRKWVLCQALSSMMSHPMTNSEWVTLLYFFAGHSDQSCPIPWPKGCEWHCLILLPGTLIRHVSSHDQQIVSDATLFLCQVLINHVSFHDQQQVSDTA